MPKLPHKIADVLNELLARRGFARVQATEKLHRAWQSAAGEVLAAHSKVCGLRRGVLEVRVANSALLQELSFRKVALLRDLIREAPDESIQDVRFRLGSIS